MGMLGFNIVKWYQGEHLSGELLSIVAQNSTVLSACLCDCLTRNEALCVFNTWWFWITEKGFLIFVLWQNWVLLSTLSFCDLNLLFEI